jgi:cystathionine gamma-lyase
MTVAEHQIDTPPRAPSPVHRFGTLAVHAGSPHDPVTGAVIEPVSVLVSSGTVSPSATGGSKLITRLSDCQDEEIQFHAIRNHEIRAVSLTPP